MRTPCTRALSDSKLLLGVLLAEDSGERWRGIEVLEDEDDFLTTAGCACSCREAMVIWLAREASLPMKMLEVRNSGILDVDDLEEDLSSWGTTGLREMGWWNILICLFVGWMREKVI